MIKTLVLIGLCLGVSLVEAQTIPQPPDPEGPTILIRGQLPPPDLYMSEGLRDYGNLWASLNGIYDDSMPYTTLTPDGSNIIQKYGGWGGQLAGGFNLYRRLKLGLFYVSYSGSYSRYGRSQYANGTGQNLSIAYSKQLSRRWSVRATDSMLYSYSFGSIYALVPSASIFPSVQPYNQRVFLNMASATLGYQATHRLSYFIGGDFQASLYKPSQISGYTGLNGVTGASYRLTARTTLTGSYTLSHLNYTDSTIISNIQTGALTLSHTLTRRIEVGASVGVSDISSSGTSIIYFQNLPSNYYAQGYYKVHTLSPDYTLSIYRTGLRSRFGITGGEGVTGGNGLFLTSRNIFVNAMANYQVTKQLSLSGMFGYSRLSGVAYIGVPFPGRTYNVSAGYQLRRHTFLNAAYSELHYPQYGNVQTYNPRRLTFGITFATTDFPLPY